MPKVSVIMPTYNRKNVIGRAIDSVLQQSFKDFELIIADDGSSDGTEKSLKKTLDADSRIKFLKQENKGASAARNLAISKASGKYLAFLDTDNAWHSNFLEVMAGELDTDATVLMVYSSQNLILVSVDQKGKERTVARKVRSEPYNPYGLIKGNYIDVNSVVLRAKLLKDLGGFDESLRTYEDWDLFARIAIKHPFSIKHVDQVLMDYYYSEQFDTATNKAHPQKAIRSYMGKWTPNEGQKKVLKNIKKYSDERNALKKK